ncbi:MAG: trigger factor [Syntrophales bacterium]|jgi:FKBP-type peptidyl-prolyl cis-trans isomerase (trigger factor)
MKVQPKKTMEIVAVNDNDGRKRLSITAPWEDVIADYDDIVDEYSKVRIPGFRVGKTPRSVVENRFQREIMDELSHRCGRRLGRDALNQEGVEPMGPIEIADIECGKGKPFRFIARFSPMPEFELPDFGLFKIWDDSTDPRDLISTRLLETVNFEVPDELIRMELNSDIRDDPNQERTEWKCAEERVRLMLILKRIARQQGIEVDESDVERRIGEKAVEFGINPNTLKTEFEKGGGKQRLKDMLLVETTLDFLIEKSRGTSVVN